MSDNIAEADKLTGNLQESLLCLLCFGGARGQIAAGLIQPEVFEEAYGEIAKRAIDYRAKYGEAPGKEHIDDLFDYVISDPGNKRAPMFQRILMSLYKQSDGLNEQYVLDRVSEFVRRQTYKTAIFRGAQRIQQGGDGVGDDLESILGEAFRFRADHTDPGTFLGEASALSFLQADTNDTLKLGIPEFDRLDINPTRGELFVFIAPRGRGKSWLLTHCSVMGLLQRWRVLDVSLEMSEKKKTQRIFQAAFAVAKRDDEYMQTILDIDSLGQLAALTHEQRRPSMALSNAKIGEYLAAQQQQWRGPLNRIVVKQYPTGSLTIRKLKSYLDFLEQAKGFVPDLLCIDYPKLMYIDPDHPRESLGRLFEELRGLAVERNMALVAPHQSTRAGETASSLRSQHTSDDISIIGTADTVVTYNATEEERAIGLARLTAIKVRNDEDMKSVLLTQNYRTGQFVLQSVPQRGDYWEMMRSFTGAQGGVAPEEDP